MRLTVIIPAHNEAGYIEPCLKALLAQDESAGSMDVIVAANACTDDTVAISIRFAEAFEARGSSLAVLDLSTPGKTAALNAAEAKAGQGARIYLDADVVCDPALLGHLRGALDCASPRYVTGTLVVSPARSRVTKAYARVWQKVPFVAAGTVGAGLFAVNPPGRARWGAFPDIISDDTFVRLNFAPEERLEVPACYHWPMIEGFSRLVRVRRRQDEGVAEVRRLYPALTKNDNTPDFGLVHAGRIAVADPVGFLVYLSVRIAAKAARPKVKWARGR